MNVSSKILAAALMAAATPWLVAPVAAAPASPLAMRNTVAPSVETVQYRRGGYRAGYRGGIGGVGLGLAAGAIVGGAIVGAQGPYGYGYGGYVPGYAYAPGYAAGYAYAPGDDQEGYVAASPYGGGGESAYCQQRFRSYDPASGTYLGLDGRRHPCP